MARMRTIKALSQRPSSFASNSSAFQSAASLCLLHDHEASQTGPVQPVAGQLYDQDIRVLAPNSQLWRSRYLRAHACSGERSSAPA